MGRSAKLHKRTQKKTTSSSGAPAAASAPTKKPAAPTPVEQKKKAGLKAKVKAITSGAGKREGPVLGGADYVDIMLGGRRRAAEEGMKIPRDEEE